MPTSSSGPGAQVDATVTAAVVSPSRTVESRLPGAAANSNGVAPAASSAASASVSGSDVTQQQQAQQQLSKSPSGPGLPRAPVPGTNGGVRRDSNPAVEGTAASPAPSPAGSSATRLRSPSAGSDDADASDSGSNGSSSNEASGGCVPYGFQRTLPSDLAPPAVLSLLQGIQAHNPSLFSEWAAPELSTLAHILTALKFAPGEAVIEAGEGASFIAILLSGTLEVQLPLPTTTTLDAKDAPPVPGLPAGTDADANAGGVPSPSAASSAPPSAPILLTPGGLIGELSCFEGGTRTARVVVHGGEEACVAVLTFAELNSLSLGAPEVRLKVMCMYAIEGLKKLRRVLDAGGGDARRFGEAAGAAALLIPKSSPATATATATASSIAAPATATTAPPRPSASVRPSPDHSRAPSPAAKSPAATSPALAAVAGPVQRSKTQLRRGSLQVGRAGDHPPTQPSSRRSTANASGQAAIAAALAAAAASSGGNAAPLPPSSSTRRCTVGGGGGGGGVEAMFRARGVAESALAPSGAGSLGGNDPDGAAALRRAKEASRTRLASVQAVVGAQERLLLQRASQIDSLQSELVRAVEARDRAHAAASRDAKALAARGDERAELHGSLLAAQQHVQILQRTVSVLEAQVAGSIASKSEAHAAEWNEGAELLATEQKRRAEAEGELRALKSSLASVTSEQASLRSRAALAAESSAHDLEQQASRLTQMENELGAVRTRCKELETSLVSTQAAQRSSALAAEEESVAAQQVSRLFHSTAHRLGGAVRAHAAAKRILRRVLVMLFVRDWRKKQVLRQARDALAAACAAMRAEIAKERPRGGGDRGGATGGSGAAGGGRGRGGAPDDTLLALGLGTPPPASAAALAAAVRAPIIPPLNLGPRALLGSQGADDAAVASSPPTVAFATASPTDAPASASVTGVEPGSGGGGGSGGASTRRHTTRLKGAPPELRLSDVVSAVTELAGQLLPLALELCRLRTHWSESSAAFFSRTIELKSSLGDALALLGEERKAHAVSTRRAALLDEIETALRARESGAQSETHPFLQAHSAEAVAAAAAAVAHANASHQRSHSLARRASFVALTHSQTLAQQQQQQQQQHQAGGSSGSSSVASTPAPASNSSGGGSFTFASVPSITSPGVTAPTLSSLSRRATRGTSWGGGGAGAGASVPGRLELAAWGSAAAAQPPPVRSTSVVGGSFSRQLSLTTGGGCGSGSGGASVGTILTARDFDSHDAIAEDETPGGHVELDHDHDEEKGADIGRAAAPRTAPSACTSSGAAGLGPAPPAAPSSSFSSPLISPRRVRQAHAHAHAHPASKPAVSLSPARPATVAASASASATAAGSSKPFPSPPGGARSPRAPLVAQSRGYVIHGSASSSSFGSSGVAEWGTHFSSPPESQRSSRPRKSPYALSPRTRDVDSRAAVTTAGGAALSPERERLPHIEPCRSGAPPPPHAPSSLSSRRNEVAAKSPASESPSRATTAATTVMHHIIGGGYGGGGAGSSGGSSRRGARGAIHVLAFGNERAFPAAMAEEKTAHSHPPSAAFASSTVPQSASPPRGGGAPIVGPSSYSQACSSAQAIYSQSQAALRRGANHAKTSPRRNKHKQMHQIGGSSSQQQQQQPSQPQQHPSSPPPPADAPLSPLPSLTDDADSHAPASSSATSLPDDADTDADVAPDDDEPVSAAVADADPLAAPTTADSDASSRPDSPPLPYSTEKSTEAQAAEPQEPAPRRDRSTDPLAAPADASPAPDLAPLVPAV